MNNPANDNFIYGKNPVTETLERNPKKVEKIFFKESFTQKDFVHIINLAKENKIPYTFVPEKKMRELAGDDRHQGVIATVGETEYLTFENWEKTLDKNKNNVVLLLNEIEDPHNFGAIIRNAAAFGVSSIFVGKHNQAPVSATVYKASVGTISSVPIVRVSNINDTVSKLKELKFWTVALAGETDKNIFEEDLKYSIAFVVGNEGEGVGKKIKENCDMILKIPMSNNVESLNASVSAGIALYEWRRQNF